MSYLKLPLLKNDKNNKFLIELVKKLNTILSIFDKSIKNLTDYCNSLDIDVTELKNTKITTLDVESANAHFTDDKITNNSYCIETTDKYILNIAVSIFNSNESFTMSDNLINVKFDKQIPRTYLQALTYNQYPSNCSISYNLLEMNNTISIINTVTVQSATSFTIQGIAIVEK